MKRLIILFFLGFQVSVYAQEIRSVKATDVEKIIGESTKPLVVNMWATWCKPCIEELPYFLEEIKKQNDKNDSVDVLLVSLDFKDAFPSAIRSFAVKKKMKAPIVWLNETNADYFCPKIDSNWSGGIPATLFINNKTGYRNFIEGKISRDDVKKQIKTLVAK